jgi:hypothetical protein
MVVSSAGLGRDRFRLGHRGFNDGLRGDRRFRRCAAVAYDSGIGVTALKLAGVQFGVVVVEVCPTAHTPQYITAFRYIRVWRAGQNAG